jgi:SAM-dependent methyltransferase
MQSYSKKNDDIVHGMDWLSGDLKDFELSNYRKYQYDLIAPYLGKQILEVGAGDRSFTCQIVKNHPRFDKIVSIEPSETLFELHKDKYNLPNNVIVTGENLFDLTPETHGLFDTIILVHVLEHIEKDRDAVSHLHSLLLPHGRVLIEVPAMQFLFSVHDTMLGHYRRYNKSNFRDMVNTDLFTIEKLWFQDAIGILGSFFFFKMKKIELKSNEGAELVKNQGKIYDKYVIPFEKFYEQLITLPFGLSLTGILIKK